MFHVLGQFVVRWWKILLVAWICLLVGVRISAPEWDSVVQTGEFAFLPDHYPSRQGEEMFRRTFPNDMLSSSVVIVVRRESHPDGLLEADEIFIQQVLKPRLIEIANDDGQLRAAEQVPADQAAETDDPEEELGSIPENSIIVEIRTTKDQMIGQLLQSEDNKSSLVFVELRTEFLDSTNQQTIEKIEQLIGPNGTLETERLIPPGLDLAISGSATVGRDLMQAARESSSATEKYTTILVVFLLIVIYRAPVLALIPLITVFISTKIAIALLSLLAQAGIVNLFSGIQTYVTVVLYGAGVDYCLFLIARYKEELDHGSTMSEAIYQSVTKVGSALAASAGTTICGIGMMVFAQFGKFQQAGIAVSFGLFVVLIAALTFTPALLLLFNRWAFWPRVKTERISATAGWISAANIMERILEGNWFRHAWRWVAEVQVRKPGTCWLICMGLMLPFAIISIMSLHNLSYGLLSELPAETPSVVGTKAVQQHFPAGATGPVTVLLENQNVDFSSIEGREAIESLTTRLIKSKNALNLNDIRSVSHPVGGEKSVNEQPLIRRRIMLDRAMKYYVSREPKYENHVTRIDIVFENDPFERRSIDLLKKLETTIPTLFPEELQTGSKLYFKGETASVSDLKTVTDSDQIRIDVLVLSVVFLILVILLKRVAISFYLILSVFFSYLVALGMTFTLFYLLDPEGFAGLDWKVPMFLFTILIAVGEDYNIYLMTRIDEEREKHGPVGGVTVALEKTGGIISSCGVIMAGTFASLMAGSLVGMQQLGLALACGVLLDTFVVRPILVPSYLIMLHSGKFGRLGKYMGALTDTRPAEAINE